MMPELLDDILQRPSHKSATAGHSVEGSMPRLFFVATPPLTLEDTP